MAFCFKSWSYNFRRFWVHRTGVLTNVQLKDNALCVFWLNKSRWAKDFKSEEYILNIQKFNSGAQIKPDSFTIWEMSNSALRMESDEFFMSPKSKWLNSFSFPSLLFFFPSPCFSIFRLDFKKPKPFILSHFEWEIRSRILMVRTN